MSEERHDVVLTVNGAAHAVRRARPGGCSPTRCATTSA